MKLLKKIEDAFAAVAFAEAGEFETAREMVSDDYSEKEGKTESESRTCLDCQSSKA